MKKFFDKIKQINKKHNNLVKGNGYVYSTFLIYSFFVVAFLLLAMVIYVDGIKDKVYVECPVNSYGASCYNPLYNLEGCNHYCCTINYIPKGSSCGDSVSWLGRNYAWVVFLLFFIVLLINHFVFNKNYDFNKYWGDWK